jgi:hypothetical protein
MTSSFSNTIGQKKNVAMEHPPWKIFRLPSGYVKIAVENDHL